jgi:hypothetical protein
MPMKYEVVVEAAVGATVSGGDIVGAWKPALALLETTIRVWLAEEGQSSGGTPPIHGNVTRADRECGTLFACGAFWMGRVLRRTFPG